MKTLAICVGHGPKNDLGAVASDGTTERDWNRDLASRIVLAIGDRARAVIVLRGVEKQPPIAMVNALKADLAIELHLNAFNGNASGTEMIYWPASIKGKALAAKLQIAAVRALKLPDRGIKGPQAGGRGTAFLRQTNMPAVICESFFIDNAKDLARGNMFKDSLAVAYANALLS